ncbi:MAG: hypothetical protein Q4P24_06960 [Rhodobacterales bacterium]|nr:hypothetical protein [Rhodobacterales bacterium]
MKLIFTDVSSMMTERSGCRRRSGMRRISRVLRRWFATRCPAGACKERCREKAFFGKTEARQERDNLGMAIPYTLCRRQASHRSRSVMAASCAIRSLKNSW